MLNNFFGALIKGWQGWRAGMILATMVLLAGREAARAQFTFTTNSGALTITGYTGSNGTVVIPAVTNGYRVISIGNSAFLGHPGLTNVVIPYGITNIDVQAFADCAGLTGVVIPDSVTNLGSSAFLDCSGLASMTMGNGVISIGYDAFWGCTSLTNATISKNVASFKGTVFTGCTSLTNISVDPQNTVYSSVAGVLFDKKQGKIIEYPFGRAGIYNVPGSVTNIGQYAFYACAGLTNCALSNLVTIIEDNAFAECSGLTNFIIPTNVVTIGEDSFGGCGNLTNIFIPYGVTNIGTGAFGSCTRLAGINVDPGNTFFSSSGGVLFNFHQTKLLAFPTGKSGTFLKPGSYSIPDGVTNIGEEAFVSCLLSNIVIPSSVTFIGEHAFSACTNSGASRCLTASPASGTAHLKRPN
jgi:hypothetical protein